MLQIEPHRDIASSSKGQANQALGITIVQNPMAIYINYAFKRGQRL
ncbi:MAG TPA: hypothetical protein V6D12_05720 [Candidatus Obscuribacterales bacterium]